MPPYTTARTLQLPAVYQDVIMWSVKLSSSGQQPDSM